jgi:DNA-binding MarR family transcriptional regulator
MAREKARRSGKPYIKRATPPAITSAAAHNWRQENIGRLLNGAVRRFEARIIDLMAEDGHAETRISHISFTRNLDQSGTRVTELAQRSAMTKQAMGELVDQCVDLGLVERRPDPADGRARVVMFTAMGLKWLEHCRRAVVQAEDEMRQELGSRQLDLVKRALKRYGASHPSLGTGA